METIVPETTQKKTAKTTKGKVSKSGKILGSRCQVFRGNATHTSGRLTKDDLLRNQHGRIVSKKRHEQGKLAIKYLEKGGYKGVLPSKRKAKTSVSSESESLSGGALAGGASVLRSDGETAYNPDILLDK